MCLHAWGPVPAQSTLQLAITTNEGPTPRDPAQAIVAQAGRPGGFTASATLTRVGTGTVETFANGALQDGSATHVLLGGANYVCVVSVRFFTAEPITVHVRGRIIRPDGSVHSPARLLRCPLKGKNGSVELAFVTVRMEEAR